ncbi:MAG: nitrile hydratase subunit beta [Candidatus Rokubacteria bacterium]|nr:nitrile hydratase subunit beta [Candidatus Rokubacteria bacterium]
MNGVHDMGGMHGMGPIVREKNEPVFHAEWERRAFALTLAAAYPGQWNTDMSRQAREQMPPAEYLATTYYEHWLFGLERLLAERALVTPDEVEARLAGRAAPVTKPEPAGRVLAAADVGKVLRKGGSARVHEDVPPRFKPGDRVVARNINPRGHTRLPRYARGRHGVIDRDHGVFVFPDTHAAGLGARPQHVYSVRFGARELWGPEASARDGVYIDLWDDYLDRA